MSKPIGILGLGFFGNRLLAQAGPDSWGLSHEQGFDLFKPSDWEQIPLTTATLVLTIPPLADIAQNRARLLAWASWMAKQRPNLKKLIYISSTAVYPMESGSYEENCILLPTKKNGLLRLESEAILSRHFQLTSLRCGGIYGPDRNLLTRLKEKKPTRSLDGPTHRIHVEDLVRLVLFLLEKERIPPVLNVVDMDPAPVREVLGWLVAEGLIAAQSLPSVEPAKERLISNQRLLDLGFEFDYPSYREGYKEL